MDDDSIVLKSSMTFIIFPSEYCMLTFIYCMLDSIVACMIMNYSSDLLSILLVTFGILKLQV